MIAFVAVPQTVVHLGAWLAIASVALGGAYLAPLRRPFKWLGRTLISDPLSRWFRGIIREELNHTEHLVSYHLGPNSGTPPIHERITAIEDFVTDARARTI